MTEDGTAAAQDGGAAAENGSGKGAETDWEAKYHEAIKHARTWEKRAGENQKAADRLKELEEADKTDLEKALEAQKAAEDELAALKASAELDKARAKVASETGVPAEFVVGDDEESMREHAKRLAAHFKADPAPGVKGAGSFARNANDDPETAAKRALAGQLFNRG